ncbi:MAG: hypothetical protein JWN32_1248 [Solirubrobacterales bacterium]|nr:hypothetical protein [Solirubrobacterales bacterium]
MPYEGPQIKDYGTVAELTAAHQLFSGMPGPSVSLLAFSGHSTPLTPAPTTQVLPSTATGTHTPAGSSATGGTSPLEAVMPGTSTGGGPTGGAAGAHSVPGGSGKLPYTGLDVVGETLLGAGAVVTGFLARRFSRKPSSSD